MDTNSVGQSQPEMQDETPRQNNGVGSEQQPGQYPSGGNAANAAHSAPQPERWGRLPQGLRDRAQWCVAGEDKSPRIAADGLPRARSTDPTTWRDFETACAYAARYGLHIGYMLHEDDPFTCIDMDVKPDTTQGQIDRFSMIVEQADSYAEHSRSGQGLHVWLEGKIGEGCKRDGVEVYSQERFMICTGDVTVSKPIKRQQELLDNMVGQMRGQQCAVEPLADEPEIESDEAILERARSASNADKFNAHFSADWQAIGHTDHSTADAALIGMLANYTGSNAQLKRLFLGSALGQRDKSTKRKDYVDRTIKSIRSMQAQEPNALHGERMAAALIYNEWRKRIAPHGVVKSTRKLRLVSEEEMASRPPIGWRVRDVLPAEGLVAIYGPPGSGKSFLVLDMLGAIASGRLWFGHKVNPAPVVYVALEGKAGVAQRVRAYRAKRGPMQGVKFFEENIDLRLPADRDSLVEVITEAGWANGVVCIDTLAASAPGMDENTSTDMGALIASLQEMQQALGGCVLVVHHTGKDQTKGLRGWSGLTGALDGSIEVSRADARREWRVTKAKDGEDGIATPFQLESVVLNLDEDGMPITSCIVVTGEAEATKEEATEQVLALIKEYYDRGEYIATAANSPNNAFKILKDDPQYPRNLPRQAVLVLLREAERAGLLKREKYRNGNRNEVERWRVK